MVIILICKIVSHIQYSYSYYPPAKIQMKNAKITQNFRNFGGKKNCHQFRNEVQMNVQCSCLYDFIIFVSDRRDIYAKRKNPIMKFTRNSEQCWKEVFWHTEKKKCFLLKSKFERVIRSIHILWGFRCRLLWQLCVPSNLLRNVLPPKLAIFVCYRLFALNKMKNHTHIALTHTCTPQQIRSDLFHGLM